MPTGRAFKMPLGGSYDRLMTALAQSEARAWSDAVSTFDSILPDNPNFTADDATDWERRLGMINGTGVDMADRKLAIKRKINHPGTVEARQHYLYIQGQLRNAGFDVYVHENLSRVNPGTLAESAELGDHELGDFQLGPFLGERIVNKIELDGDQDFASGTSFSNIFFIGGVDLGDTATIPEERHFEFRELVLRLKPQNQFAYLFINFV